MNDWKIVKLKDILAEKGYIRGPFGSALKRGEMQQTGIPVYEQEHAINDIRKFRYFIDNKKYDELKRFTVSTNDIIISCSGTVGRISIIKENDPKGIISQALLILRTNSKLIDVNYLKYFLRSRVGQNALLERSNGSVQVNICKREIIEAIPIPLPTLNIQNKISSILSIIDRKIENNTQINWILEQQAQAIFKSWFIDFEPFQDGNFIDSELGPIPEGWRVGILQDIAQITMGQSPSGDSYNEIGKGCVFYQGRAEFGSRFPTRRLFTTSPKRMAKAGDVLLSVRAPVGDLNLAYEDCCIGRGLAALQSNNCCPAYLIYQMNILRPQFDVFNSQGTVFGCINKDSLHSIKIILPPAKVQKNFEELANPMERLIRKNYMETCSLQISRDTLLPKLISGELDVSEVEL